MFNNFLTQSTPRLIRGAEQLRQHLLWLSLIRVVFFTLLIGIIVGLKYLGTPVLLPPATITIAFLSIIYIYSIGSAALLYRDEAWLQRFGRFQLLTDTFFAALLIYGTGCSQSIFTPVFMLPVIAGGMIMYRSGGIMAAAAATIFYGVVLLLEYTGNIPGYLYITESPPQLDIQKATSMFTVYGITFFLAALLSGTLAARLRTTEQTLERTALDYDRLSLLYKQIFDDINTGIITVDKNGNISSYNTSAYRITGFSAEEVTGLPLSNFFSDLMLEEMSIRQVVDLKRKDGSITRVGYSFSHLNLPPSHTNIEQQNYSSSMLITMQDISKIEEMEKRMRKAEKMAAIGELSASIAHDFRNPLAAICGSAQLLVFEKDKENSTNKILNDIILREGNRMARTISDFLQFSQPAPPQNEWFNLYRLINEIIVTSNSVNGKTAITEFVQIDCLETFVGFGDRQQIQTVITHLVNNAVIMGTEKDGPVVVRAGETDINEEKEQFYIEVIDKGRGIEKKNMENIFKPFFSTKENKTGLGLTIVQQIVERHKGRIEVKSKPGHGCSIRVTLPLPDANTEEKGNTQSKNELRTR